MEETGGKRDSSSKFDIIYHDGFACVAVYPERNDVSLDEVTEKIIAELKALGLSNFNRNDVEKVVVQQSGKFTPISKWPGGIQLAPRIRVSCANDAMAATIQVTPPKVHGGDVTLSMIRDKLKEAGIQYGFDKEAIKRIVHNRLYNQEITVARGEAPIDGESAINTFHFEKERGRPRLREDGSADYKEIAFIQFKRKNDRLVSVIPPKGGKEGMDIFGNPLPPKEAPRSEVILAGDNTRREADGTIVATIDGQAILDGKTVSVEKVLRVRQVDYRTGNLTFDGNLVVDSEILNGFSVDVTGDVEVKGFVGHATIKAGGNVYLHAGANGDGRGIIEAGGNVHARYFETFNIECDGDLIVDQLMMNTFASVKGRCIVLKRRGEIIGGRVISTKGIFCRKIGNKAGIRTVAVVGILPEWYRNYLNIVRQIGIREEVETQEMRSQPSDQERSKTVPLHNSPAIDKLRKELHEMIHDVQLDPQAVIAVEKSVYSGAFIRFGTTHLPPQKIMNSVQIRSKEGQFSIVGFSSVDLPFDRDAL